MKKKDILELLEYRKCVLEDKYVSRLCKHHFTDKYGCPQKGDHPNTLELQKDFELIDKELNQLRSRRRKFQQHMKDNKEKIGVIKCNHPIISGYRNVFGYSFHCMLCGEYGDNFDEKRWEIENNRVCLLHNDGYDDEPSEEELLIDYAYDIEEYERFSNLIISMLKDKNDNEEIDFIREFNKDYEKYNIGSISIKEKEKTKKEVLVICGSNTIKITDEIILKKKIKFDKNITGYLSKIKDINLHYIANPGIDIEGLPHIINYETMDELSDSIKKKTDYDIVIDFSRLFDYRIVNGEIKISDVILDLTKLFPNSEVIPVRNVHDEIELYERIRKMIANEKGYEKTYERRTTK